MDAVNLEDMREFISTCLEYDQHTHVAIEGGRDSVLARRRERVDSATKNMVADEFYDVKPWTDLSEHELKKGL